jgi:hypothetical protein
MAEMLTELMRLVKGPQARKRMPQSYGVLQEALQIVTLDNIGRG